jgi:hypothetical protein
MHQSTPTPPLLHTPRMWRALLVAMCCAWAGCSLLRAPVDAPDAGPDDASDAGPTDAGPTDAGPGEAPTITRIDGTGTERAVVGSTDVADAVPAVHRLQDTLRVYGEHLDVVTSAVLLDDSAGSDQRPIPLALLQATSSTERDMRLPSTISAALYTLVLFAAGGEARAGVFLLQGEQGLQGEVGLTALVETTTLQPGGECAAGGLTVSTGIDTNRDGVLNDGEVDPTQTKTVCAPTADDALNCTDDVCVLTQPLIVEGSITADLVDTGALTATTADLDDVVANDITSATATIDDIPVDNSSLAISNIDPISVATEEELHAAFASLDGRRIAGNVDIVVTQDIEMTTQVTVRHPDGERIRLLGAAPTTQLTFPSTAHGIVVIGGGLTIEQLTLAGSGGNSGIFSQSGARVRVNSGVTVSGFGVGINATAADVSLGNGTAIVGTTVRSGTGVFATDGAVVRSACTTESFVDVSHFRIGWLARNNAVIIADRCSALDVERGFNVTFGAFVSAVGAEVQVTRTNLATSSFAGALAGGSSGLFDELKGTGDNQGISVADGAAAQANNITLSTAGTTLSASRNGTIAAQSGTGTAFTGSEGVVAASSGYACSGTGCQVLPPLP